MQKIILKTMPGYDHKNFDRDLKYIATLIIVTFVCYFCTSFLVTLQALMSWEIIYNTTLLIFGTPPKIDNIYYLEVNGENQFLDYLEGSNKEFSLVTELFVLLVSFHIIVHNIVGGFFNVTNLFMLLLSIYFWRNLLFLLRGIHQYGQQSIDNSLSHQYTRHGQFKKPLFYIICHILVLAFYSLFILIFWIASDYGQMKILLSYVLFVYFSTREWRVTGIVVYFIIIISILTVLQFHFINAPYSLVLFLLLLTTLIIYLIFISAKDTLLRESHIILSDELSCEELKHDIKAYIESFVMGTKCVLYFATVLYCVFVILMFCSIFRLDFAYPFSTIFGLDYFYKVFSVI